MRFLAEREWTKRAWVGGAFSARRVNPYSKVVDGRGRQDEQAWRVLRKPARRIALWRAQYYSVTNAPCSAPDGVPRAASAVQGAGLLRSARFVVEADHREGLPAPGVKRRGSIGRPTRHWRHRRYERTVRDRRGRQISRAHACGGRPVRLAARRPDGLSQRSAACIAVRTRRRSCGRGPGVRRQGGAYELGLVIFNQRPASKPWTGLAEGRQ